MKNTVLSLVFFISISLGYGQYSVDFSKASLNEVPEKYTLAHFNLKGPVKAYKDQFSTYTFNARGAMDGYGRYFFKDGSYYGGEWKDGQRTGKAYSFNKDNKTSIGEFNNGVLIKTL